MKDKKLEYIEILLKKREDVFLGGSYSLIIHSILNTFDLIELIDFYLPLKDTKLKRSIESNIYKRVLFIQNPDNIYDILQLRLKETDYFQRQRIRKILMLLLPLLTFRRRFFMIHTDFQSAVSRLSASKFDTYLYHTIIYNHFSVFSGLRCLIE